MVVSHLVATALSGGGREGNPLYDVRNWPRHTTILTIERRVITFASLVEPLGNLEGRWLCSYEER